MREDKLFEMREALDLDMIFWRDEEEKLEERHRAQWAAMTDEEIRVYETVMLAIHPMDDELPLWKRLPLNYFRDRTVEELEREIREKYGADERLSERLRTVMQDILDVSLLMVGEVIYENDRENGGCDTEPGGEE